VLGLNGLALCAGVGGLERGIESIIPSARTVCYVEGETYPASVLASKMEAGSLPKAPIWSNVRTFDGEAWCGKVSFISGGFPCQPYSKAGKQLADKDPRDLWPDFARIIGEVRPHFIFLENVPNVVKWASPTVLKDLSEMGYDAAWCVVAASQVGAPHKRSRWFLFAYPNDSSKHAMRFHETQSSPQKFEGIDMAHTDSQSHSKPQRTAKELRKKGSRLEGSKDKRETWHIVRGSGQKIPDAKRIRGRQNNRFRKSNKSNQDGERWNFGDWWKVEPGMGRMVDGVADWVHRMRACGNGVVPQQAAYAYSILMERCGFMVSRP
jgi:DNA (cytosine-5)-methyltransferase 1